MTDTGSEERDGHLMPSAPYRPSVPSLVVLPILTGHTADLGALVSRTRDFLSYRESQIGPWVFDPAIHGGSLWQWVAREGLGDSCRDARILDEFIEVVFAHDTLSGTVGVTAWRPSTRGILTEDSVILNQTLSFIAAHLVQPEQFAFVRSPQIGGVEPVSEFQRNMEAAEGAGASTSLGALAGIAMMNASFSGTDGDGDCLEYVEEMLEEDMGDGLITFRMPVLSPAHFVADWLDVLLRDYQADDSFARVEVPRGTDAMHTRLDALYAQLFEPGPHIASAFRMTLEALFDRVVRRTNEMRVLYGHLESVWPPVSAPRITYPTAHLTFCTTTPELARMVAQVPCTHCEGCAGVSDLHLVDQLRLAV